MKKTESTEMKIPRTSVPAFSPIVDEGVNSLEELPAPHFFPADRRLIDQGDSPVFVGVVLAGILKLTFSDGEGKEVTLGLRSKGWWLNAQLALLKLQGIYRVTTVSECTISLLPVEGFSDFLFNQPLLMRSYLLSQSRELVSAQQQMFLRAGSAEERLRYFLQEDRTSVWTTENPTNTLRQGAIADLLGITPEHLSRLRSRRAIRQQKWE